MDKIKYLGIYLVPTVEPVGRVSIVAWLFLSTDTLYGNLSLFFFFEVYTLGYVAPRL